VTEQAGVPDIVAVSSLDLKIIDAVAAGEGFDGQDLAGAASGAERLADAELARPE
jgi:hypothetical protein